MIRFTENFSLCIQESRRLNFASENSQTIASTQVDPETTEVAAVEQPLFFIKLPESREEIRFRNQDFLTKIC